MKKKNTCYCGDDINKKINAQIMLVKLCTALGH